MTWIKFALWLCGIYLIYYTGMFLWDFLRKNRYVSPDNSAELTFIEHHEPEKLEKPETVAYTPSAISSSGGVNLKQLFNLAREEAIEYTRAVSF